MDFATARDAGQKTYFTGKPCCHGHVAPRLVSDKKCLVCKSARQRVYRKENPTYGREWHQARPGYKNEWYKNAKPLQLEPAQKEARLEYYRDYYAKNFGYYRAKGSKKAAQIRCARPTWADNEKIAAIYKEARELTRRTGVQHEVDHIVPLLGENICGLHVIENLQILTRHENRRKSNKPPDLSVLTARLIGGFFHAQKEFIT